MIDKQTSNEGRDGLPLAPAGATWRPLDFESGLLTFATLRHGARMIRSAWYSFDVDCRRLPSPRHSTDQVSTFSVMCTSYEAAERGMMDNESCSGHELLPMQALDAATSAARPPATAACSEAPALWRPFPTIAHRSIIFKCRP